MYLSINDETMKRLQQLAAESKRTPEEMFEYLVKKYDEERHVVWSATHQKHMRVKCRLDGCLETTERSEAGNIRD